MPSRHVADVRQVEGKTGRKLEEWCALLEANGLVVPVIRDADQLSIHGLNLAIADDDPRPDPLRRPQGRNRLMDLRSGFPPPVAAA